METLNKTWFVDVDGTILYHQTNDSLDELIEEYGDDSFKYEQPIVSAVDFFQDLPETDIIVISSARPKKYTDHTLNVLEYIGMPFDQWIFELEPGPRIVVNDIKPPGVAGNKRALKTAYGINLDRDGGITLKHRTIAAKI